MSARSGCEIRVVLDNSTKKGLLHSNLPQFELQEIESTLVEIQKKYNFQLEIIKEDSNEVYRLSKYHFGRGYKETHCFRGYPIYGSIRQFHDIKSDYILHFDCDMLFYEKPNYSWIKEGIRLMEENQDILCVLPRGGPPTLDRLIHQGTTKYNIDEENKVYRFKNFTSRHYLVHRERFLKLLPMKPQWLSWREPYKSRLFGNGKMLCWESTVGNALNKSPFWRVDLITKEAWSIHPGDRSELFYELLPEIVKSIKDGKYPEEQKGHFDLQLDSWGKYLHDQG